METKRQVNLYLHKYLATFIKKQSAIENRSMSDLVEELVEKYQKKVEKKLDYN